MGFPILARRHLYIESGPRLLKFCLMEDKDAFVPHSQYCGCGWLGDARSQGIISHGIDLYSSFSTWRVKLLLSQYFQGCLATNITGYKNDVIYTNFAHQRGSEFVSHLGLPGTNPIIEGSRDCDSSLYQVYNHSLSRWTLANWSDVISMG